MIKSKNVNNLKKGFVTYSNDKVMTHYEDPTISEAWIGYVTSVNTYIGDTNSSAFSIPLSIGASSTVRTIMYSARDSISS